ncbi:MAG: thioesterase family protein [Bacteroidota bacterium]|nr:thioesterase family protein [Bacteroidota bacterium]
MYKSETKIRVRYADTDQMGYVYYGKYAEYYEVARTELIRGLGFTYREFEERGIMLPVSGMKIKYFRAALYDELITMVTRLDEMPTARIRFVCEMFNEEGQKLNEGEVSLVFSDATTRRPSRPPKDLIDKLKPYFS